MSAKRRAARAQEREARPSGRRGRTALGELLDTPEGVAQLHRVVRSYICRCDDLYEVDVDDLTAETVDAVLERREELTAAPVRFARKVALQKLAALRRKRKGHGRRRPASHEAPVASAARQPPGRPPGAEPRAASHAGGVVAATGPDHGGDNGGARGGPLTDSGADEPDLVDRIAIAGLCSLIQPWLARQAPDLTDEDGAVGLDFAHHQALPPGWRGPIRAAYAAAFGVHPEDDMCRRVARTLRWAIDQFYGVAKDRDPSAWARELASDEVLAALGAREERIRELFVRAAPGQGGADAAERSCESLVLDFVNELHAAFLASHQLDDEPFTRAQMFGD